MWEHEMRVTSTSGACGVTHMQLRCALNAAEMCVYAGSVRVCWNPICPEPWAAFLRGWMGQGWGKGGNGEREEDVGVLGARSCRAAVVFATPPRGAAASAAQNAPASAPPAQQRPGAHQRFPNSTAPRRYY